MYGSPIQLVTKFEYQGNLFSSALSLSNCITYIFYKTRTLLGPLYRYLYCHLDNLTLLRLNTSLIHPHLEYSSFLWNPQQSNLSSHLEKKSILCLYYVVIIVSQTTLLFSLSFIFLHYLLAVAMLNLSFSSCFFIIT